MPINPSLYVVAGGIVLFLLIIPLIISRILTTVDAGTIRIVSWLRGATKIYKGPCKATEIPLFTTATTIPSKAINIDLDIADQTADIDRNGQPRPVKVRVLASAIVSVGDSNETIKTAANKFFAKPMVEQTSTLTDLLTSTGRRAINLLHHDELFNSRVTRSGPDGEAVPVVTAASVSTEDDDRLAVIIKSACSRELQDLGLVFNSLNIKEVQSEVAEARRRQSAVEAKANADIVTADQERRAREAQIAAEQAINDKQREFEQRRAQNAAQIAEAEAAKQMALAKLREAELVATQIAQAKADAERVKVEAEAGAEADAIRVRKVADAQAEAILKVNGAINQGGQSYLALRQLELLPEIVPSISNALAHAKLVTISSDGKGAASGTTDQITSVIQTVLAAQLVNRTLGTGEPRSDAPTEPQSAMAKTSQPAPEPKRPETPKAVQPPPAQKPRITFDKPGSGGDAGR